MDTRTDKLIQQAGKFIQQGKFSHALEQYLKAHQLNPGETTILNMIGDLYVRLGKETEALLWYHRLADAMRSQELLSNASAAYKKILKLSPEDQDAMTALAKLYEEQGLGAKANQQYRLLAAGMVNRQEHEAAIADLSQDLRPRAYVARRSTPSGGGRWSKLGTSRPPARLT